MNLEDLSVLLVEEDVEFRVLTGEMLQALGLRDVVLVETASHALAEIKRRSFDVLLCSHRLGIERGVLRAVHQSSPATRALLMTAYAPASKMLAKTLGDAEVLEKPFSRAMLELVLRRAASNVRGLRGEVQELSLVDILQMYHHGRQSVAIALSGPIAGRVRLAKGEIVHAESASLRGLAALSRLLGASTGLITTELAPTDTDTTIQGSFQSVVLEAIAEQDEQRRSAPPLGSSMHALDATTLSLASRPLAVSDVLPGSGMAEMSRSRPPLAAFRAATWRQRKLLWLAPLLTALACLGVYLLLSPKEPGAEAGAPKGGFVPAASVKAHLEAGGGAAASTQGSVQSFSLSIDSEPSQASVTENGAVLGKTPLTLTIERASVASGPRHLVLTHEGYIPYVLEQGDSAAALRVAAKLARAQATPAQVAPAPVAPSQATPVQGGALRPQPAPRPAASASHAEPPLRQSAPAAPPARRGDGAALDIRLQR